MGRHSSDSDDDRRHDKRKSDSKKVCKFLLM